MDKPFDKIQHPFMMKTLRKLWIEGNFLNLIKGIYEKPLFSAKRLKALPLRSGTRQRCSISPFLFKHHSRDNSQDNYKSKGWRERKSILLESKKVKLSVFSDNMILYTENPMEAPENLFKINKFRKISLNKIQANSIAMTNPKVKLRK